jgi:hypothetical protein
MMREALEARLREVERKIVRHETKLRPLRHERSVLVSLLAEHDDKHQKPRVGA